MVAESQKKEEFSHFVSNVVNMDYDSAIRLTLKAVLGWY